VTYLVYIESKIIRRNNHDLIINVCLFVDAMNKVETSDNSAINLDLLEKKIRRLVTKLERVST